MVQLKTRERHGSSHQDWRRKGAKTLWVGNCWEVNSVSSMGVGWGRMEWGVFGEMFFIP